MCVSVYNSTDFKRDVSMSKFTDVYSFVRFMLEGGYVDNPNDKGGETWCGLTKKFLQDNNIRIPPSEEDIYSGYRIIYEYLIDPVKKTPVLDDLPYEVALCIFDMLVHMGKTNAIKKLQQVLGVKVDGKYGPETHNALMREVKNNKLALCNRLVSSKLKHYAEIWGKDKSQLVFARGWVRRMCDIMDEITPGAKKPPANEA